MSAGLWKRQSGLPDSLVSHLPFHGYSRRDIYSADLILEQKSQAYEIMYMMALLTVFIPTILYVCVNEPFPTLQYIAYKLVVYSAPETGPVWDN